MGNPEPIASPGCMNMSSTSENCRQYIVADQRALARQLAVHCVRDAVPAAVSLGRAAKRFRILHTIEAQLDAAETNTPVVGMTKSSRSRRQESF